MSDQQAFRDLVADKLAARRPDLSDALLERVMTDRDSVVAELEGRTADLLVEAQQLASLVVAVSADDTTAIRSMAEVVTLLQAWTAVALLQVRVLHGERVPKDAITRSAADIVFRHLLEYEADDDADG